jgi:hypothetical protein
LEIHGWRALSLYNSISFDFFSPDVVNGPWKNKEALLCTLWKLVALERDTPRELKLFLFRTKDFCEPKNRFAIFVSYSWKGDPVAKELLGI